MTLNSVVETDFPEEFVEEMEKSNNALPERIDANPKNCLLYTSPSPRDRS